MIRGAHLASARLAAETRASAFAATHRLPQGGDGTVDASARFRMLVDVGAAMAGVEERVT